MKQIVKNKNIICSVLSFFIVFSIFICFTKEVNASISRKKLPYYVDFDSSIYFDVDLNDFHNQLLSCGFPELTDTNYIIWLGDFYNYNANSNTVMFDVFLMRLGNGSTSSYYNFYGLYNSNDASLPLVNRISPNVFDWQTNYVVFRKNGSTGRTSRYTFRWNISTQQVERSTSNPNGYIQRDYVFLSGKNASNKNSYGFTSNVPIWYRYNNGAFMSGEYRIDYSGGYDIYESFEIYTFGIPIGVPIPPNTSEDNLINPDTTPPTSPTITPYTPTTYNPPSFDNTDTTSALESIYDIFIYNGQFIIDNVNGAISNATNNIKNLFDYLKNSIDYGMQKIINNIKNGIQNMYDNIQNFFAPILEDIKETLNDIKNFGQNIKDFIDMFLHPFDLTQAQTDISNSTFISNVSNLRSQMQTFVGTFSDISEPTNIIYEIDLTNLFWSFGVWYLDFSIISPVLPYIRALMTCIILYSLIVTIFTSINSYIGGNSSKNESD